MKNPLSPELEASGDRAADAALQEKQTRNGFYAALAAYLFWGVLPFYMKAVAHIPTIEVVAHRVVWSVPIALALLIYTRRTVDIWRVIKSPRLLAGIAAAAIVISINWGIFVWSIAVDRSLEAALGYYINPLITVALGTVLLHEKLSRMQAVAIGLATLAVVIITVSSGVFPWVALVLACAFAAYGFIRKTINVGPVQGFFLEVSMLSLLALPYILWLGEKGKFLGSLEDTWLLLLGGPITAVPLILFAYGAKRLHLSTIGLMQYIVPTMVFLLAIFVFREPIDLWQIISFALIWIALGLYSWSALKSQPDD